MERYVRYFEYSAVDFKNMGNAVTSRTFKDRQKIKGRNNKGTIFVKFEEGPGILHYLCEPTKAFHGTDFDIHGNEIGETNSYEVQCQLVDWRLWFEGNWKFATLDAFKSMLNICDLKWFCSCPSFQMVGMKYQLTQANAAIYGETRPDDKWRLRTLSPRPSICKHALAVDERLLRYPQLVFKEMKSKIV